MCTYTYIYYIYVCVCVCVVGYKVASRYVLTYMNLRKWTPFLLRFVIIDDIFLMQQGYCAGGFSSGVQITTS